MKKGMFILFMLLAQSVAFSQTLESAIKSLSSDLAQKATKKHKLHLAVADFVNNTGKQDALTRYLTTQIESGLINADGEVEIIDRKHIDQLLIDNHLQSKGMIDERTAKQAGMFVAVDGWVMGDITIMGDKIKISLRVVDVQTSAVFAGAASDVDDKDAIQKIYDEEKAQNAPPPKCETHNSGDLCVSNLSPWAIKFSSNVTMNICRDCGVPSDMQTLVVPPGEQQCLYDLPVGTYTYYLMFQYAGSMPFIYAGMTTYQLTGRIKIEKCKSTVYKATNH